MRNGSREGDWQCPNPSCVNNSGPLCYAFRTECNKCGAPKPADGSGTVPPFAAYSHHADGADASFPPASSGGEYDTGNATTATATEGTDGIDRYAEAEAATEAGGAPDLEAANGGAGVDAAADDGSDADPECGRKRGREEEDEQ